MIVSDRLGFIGCMLCLVAALVPSHARAQTPGGGHVPPMTGSIIFLYYEDVERAARFFGETLGLEETYQQPGVKVFSVTPSAAVGVIDVSRADGLSLDHKTAFVTFIVDELEEVDRWRELLASRGIEVTEVSNGTETPVRSVWFSDPEGYRMELFAWLPEPG